MQEHEKKRKLPPVQENAPEKESARVDVEGDASKRLKQTWAFIRSLLPQVIETITIGFTLTIFCFDLLVHWASVGTTVEGFVLGTAFDLVVLLFFLAVGIARALKRFKGISETVYRLLHFLVSGGMLYVCFFVIWPRLVVAMGERKEDSLASGSIDWPAIIISYVLFTAAYFAVIAIANAARRAAVRRRERQKEYQSVVETSLKANKQPEE